VAHACQSLGWDWDTARRQLNIPRLKALNDYWQRSPPVHLSVAAYLGIRAKGGAGGEQPAQPVSPLQGASAILDDLLETKVSQ